MKTAGGGVEADNGAWHHFAVAGEPLATSTAGTSGGGAPDLASGEHRPTGGIYAVGIAGAAGLTLLVLVAGPRRRRRVVSTGAIVFVLAPAAALAQTTTQVVEYYTTDAVGSVRAVTKKVNGQWQVTHHDFMPFGEEVSPQYPPPDKRLFTGKERDTETGLDYFEARYLSSSVGRFSSPDPRSFQAAMLRDAQRFGLYQYCRNNPNRWIDPAGEELYAAGNVAWLQANVLFPMAGGEKDFNKYFHMSNGQVLLNDGVNPQELSSGAKLVFDLVSAEEKYLFFAGGAPDATSLAPALTGDAKEALRDFSEGGYLVAHPYADGHSGYVPSGYAGVVAWKIGAAPIQAGLGFATFAAEAPSGLGQALLPVSFFVHESSELLAFADQRGYSLYLQWGQRYLTAHLSAITREAQIRRDLGIAGGFAGGLIKR